MSENELDGKTVEQPEAEAATPNETENVTEPKENGADETVSVNGDGTATAKKPNKFLQKLDNFFGVKKAGSSFKTEIIGGLVTFMAIRRDLHRDCAFRYRRYGADGFACKTADGAGKRYGT